MQSSDIPEQVCDAAARLAPSPVLAIEELRKGANSRVFRVKAASGEFALKKYPLIDNRDRQGAEARALAYFGRTQIADTPRLIAADTQSRITLMSWLEGAAVSEVSNADVAQFAEFQVRLDQATDDAARQQIGEASEACISGARIVAQSRKRLDRLMDVRDSVASFTDFLDNSLQPALVAFEKNARASYAKLGEDFDRDLPQQRLTLIVSDFGAHNVLRTADGRLAFMDFEYFGWDDPLTSIANFVLHPGMNLTEAQRAIYTNRLITHFGATDEFRLKTLLPLYAVRWCAIILGEFLPERWHHRTQAMRGDRSWDQVRNDQLNKARRLLARFAGANAS
jgi:Ser/Thr protein kinase RdoA (MazF antagonist)